MTKVDKPKDIPEDFNLDLSLPSSKNEPLDLIEIRKKLDYQEKQLDNLWQKFNQQGLEYGMPNMIMGDMAEIMSIIDSAVGLWDDNRTMESELLQDAHISKLRDTGDLITAESMRHSQVLRLRETRITIKNFIISMREALRRMQKRLQE